MLINKQVPDIILDLLSLLTSVVTWTEGFNASSWWGDKILRIQNIKFKIFIYKPEVRYPMYFIFFFFYTKNKIMMKLDKDRDGAQHQTYYLKS